MRIAWIDYAGFRFCVPFCGMSRSSLVGAVTALLVERFLVRIPVGARGLFILQNFLAGSGAYPAPYTMSTGVLSCG